MVKAKDHKYLLQTASLGELCPKHKEAPKPPEPVLPDLPDFPDLPDIPGFGDGEPDNGGNPDGGNTGDGNTGGGESSGETQPAARTGLRRLADWIF